MSTETKPEAMTAARLEHIRKLAAIVIADARDSSPGVHTSAETLAEEEVPALLSALEDAQTLAREWRELVLGAAQELGLTVGTEATGPELLEAIGGRVRAAGQERDSAIAASAEAARKYAEAVEKLRAARESLDRRDQRLADERTRVAELEGRLDAAASSLETICRGGEYLGDVVNIRGYARNRAAVARAPAVRPEQAPRGCGIIDLIAVQGAADRAVAAAYAGHRTSCPAAPEQAPAPPRTDDGARPGDSRGALRAKDAALERVKAAIGDRLLAEGPLAEPYAHAVMREIDDALAFPVPPERPADVRAAVESCQDCGHPLHAAGVCLGGRSEEPEDGPKCACPYGDRPADGARARALQDAARMMCEHCATGRPVANMQEFGWQHDDGGDGLWKCEAGPIRDLMASGGMVAAGAKLEEPIPGEHRWLTPEERQARWPRLERDPWDSCLWCGVIRRADGKNSPCRGNVRIEMRESGGARVYVQGDEDGDPTARCSRETGHEGDHEMRDGDVTLARWTNHSDTARPANVGAAPVSNTWPAVLAFARLMEAKLQEHAPKKGGREGWRGLDARYVYGRLVEEVRELDDARRWSGSGRYVVRLARECADVANFAMMIADVTGGLDVGAAPPASTGATPDLTRPGDAAIEEARLLAQAGDPLCARNLGGGNKCGHRKSLHGCNGCLAHDESSDELSECDCPGFVPPEPEGLPRPLPNGEPNYPALAEYHRRNSVCTDGGIPPDGTAEVSDGAPARTCATCIGYGVTCGVPSGVACDEWAPGESGGTSNG